jgi:excisionase family DNA binding protein
VLLTVEEAAGVLRIGRTKAYDLARIYLATGGEDGLPTVRVGKQLRVPRHLLEELIGGPITWPIHDEQPEPAPSRSPRHTARRPSDHTGDQPRLFSL